MTRQRREEDKKLTYEWVGGLVASEHLKWKMQVCSVSMDLPLDYSLHPETTREGTIKIDSESLVRMAVDPPSYRDEPTRACEFMQSVMHAAGLTHGKLYNEYVLKLANTKYLTLPDLVKFECGPLVWVVYNDHGNWPAIYRKDTLDDQNYLTYSRKGSDVFVWDNRCGMVRADY